MYFSVGHLFANTLFFFMKEVHNKQKKISGLNLYPHYMSRKGYANLEEEMVSDHDKYCFLAHITL